jgi:hypothetical protein
MIPYLLFFSVAGIPALFHSERANRIGWAIAWLMFVLFIGLRHSVGGDWPGYILITQHIHDANFIEALNDQETLFAALTWASDRLGMGVYGVNFVGAIIFSTGLFAYCASQRNRWLALAAAVPFLVVVAVMSANRQGMALGVVLLVMSRWNSLGLVRRSIGIAIAALFHTSAAFLLVLTVADLRISRGRKVVLMLLSAVASLWLMTRSEAAWTRYTQVYIQDQPAGVFSPGAIFHLLLNLGPAILMLFFRKRWSQMLDNWLLIQQLCLAALGLLLLSPYFSVAVGRFSLYLFPISIAFFSNLPRLFGDPAARALVRTVSVVFLGGVLALWLGFGNTAFTYLPYRNVLFMHPSELTLPQ